MSDHFREVGQSAVNWKALGEIGDVRANVVQHTSDPYRRNGRKVITNALPYRFKERWKINIFYKLLDRDLMEIFGYVKQSMTTHLQ